MSEPSHFTAQQASDPATPAEVLAAIAEHRPDLRPLVASNPTAYPGLVEWLGRLGDPAVDAAIAARAAAAAAPVVPEPVAPEPVAPAPEAPTADQGFAAPGYVPPAAEVPGQPAYQPPAYGTPVGYPPAGAAPGPYGVPPAGPAGAPYGAPGAPYGGPPPQKKSLTWLWILLGIVGVLVVGGIVAFVLLGRWVSDRADEIGDIFPSINSDAESYGDDPELDALWDACEGGDMDACDDLYFASPAGSEYEDFGNTCGNRTDGGSLCADEDGATEPSPSDDSSGDNSSSGEPNAYGDDAELDALWDACEGGDMGACDDLYFSSPSDSEYEDFGDTCGNRTSGGTLCEP